MPTLKLPSSFRTSNGWAVHFDKETAVRNSFEEALERHILIATYLKSGWSGFELVDHQKVEGREIFSIVSKYTCNGYGAGMVILKDPTFIGVSFGYLCAPANEILTSPKWEHALFEALNLVERVKAGVDQFKQHARGPITLTVKDWLFSEWENPVFLKLSNETVTLPKIDPFIFECAIERYIGAPGNLQAAYHFGGGLIPLYFPDYLTDENRLELSESLSTIGCILNEKIRVPVI